MPLTIRWIQHSEPPHPLLPLLFSFFSQVTLSEGFWNYLGFFSKNTFAELTHNRSSNTIANFIGGSCLKWIGYLGIYSKDSEDRAKRGSENYVWEFRSRENRISFTRELKLPKNNIFEHEVSLHPKISRKGFGLGGWEGKQ